MERLTKRNETGTEYYYPHCFTAAGCLGTGSSAQCDECAFEHGICSKLGEYEDMEEQGRLIKLPCKVGDWAYAIKDGLINYHKVVRIEVDGNKEDDVYFKSSFDPDRMAFCTLADFGKTVFSTCQEAENVLEQMKKKEG